MAYRSLNLIVVASAAVFTVTASAQAQPAPTDGEALFTQNCSACHQITGKGIPGAFPALAGDPFVAGPPEAVATVVLNGRGGMPTFGKDLSNDEIAKILTYVRSSWGNKASPVTPAIVASARGGGDVTAPSKGTMQAH
jgi:mono/diheme cytochrome c family protein